MNKKFKRLISVILTVMMAIGMMPFSGLTTVSAAQQTKTFYLDETTPFTYSGNSNSRWSDGNAYLKIKVYNSSGNVVAEQQLTKVAGQNYLYSATVTGDYEKVQFFRMDSSNTTQWAYSDQQNVSTNCFAPTGFGTNNGVAPGTWSTYDDGGQGGGEDPTDGYTVYFNKSGNSTAQWGSTVYIYAYNSGTDNSGIQTMQSATGEYLKYTFTKRYKNVIFLDVNGWNQGMQHQTQDLTIPWGTYTNPCYTLDGGFITGVGTKTGSWSNYAGGGTPTTTTGTYFAPVDLVDYFNDARVDAGSSKYYSDKNQGDATGSRADESAAFEYFNQAISGNASAGNYNKPLYFGSLLNIQNRVGRSYQLGDHTPLARWNTTINVALTKSVSGNPGSYVDDGNFNASVQGLVRNTLDDDGNLVDPVTNKVLPYFSKSMANTWKASNYKGSDSGLLMAYYEGYQFPFKAEKIEGSTVTQYSYDSASDYAVYLDWNNLNNKQLQQNNEDHVVNDDGNNGYFPLNKPKDAGAARNYGFGTKFTIPFTVNENGTIDGTPDGEPITFNFTGDDDVWVFLDGKLILDMGGAHGKASGSINFKTLQATADNAVAAKAYEDQYVDSNSNDFASYGGLTNFIYRTENGDKRYEQERSTVSSSALTKQFSDYGTDFANSFHDSSTRHTLTMFYMERGMFDSNMKVEFTINPMPSGLTLSKSLNTADVNAGLVDAVKEADDFEFEIQSKNLIDGDTEYSTVENLGYSLNDYNNGVVDGYEATNSVVTGVNANYFAQDFINTQTKQKAFTAGTGFQITEKQSKPEKYDYSQTKWEVYDATSGSYKPVEGASGTGTTATFDMGSADSSAFDMMTYAVNFVNTPKVAPLTLTKAWQEGQTAQDGPFEFTVLLDLDGGDDYKYSVYDLAYTVNGGAAQTATDGKLSLKPGQTATIAGIPVGATYKIVETVPEDANWSSDKEENTVTGTISETGSDNAVTFTNKTNEITIDKVIYVEAGTKTEYIPSDLSSESGYESLEAKTTGITVNRGEKTFHIPNANEKHEVSYIGTKADGTKVKGTITVYSYAMSDDVYVFDYGLKSDLADTTHGVGMFQNDVLFNSNVTTIAEFSALTTDGLTQSTITATNGNLPFTLSPYDSTSSGAQLTDGQSVTFEPTAFMDKKETASYETTVLADGKTAVNSPEDGVVMDATVTVMPASVVYYEDNFNAEDTTNDSSVKIIYTGDNKPTTNPTDTQSNDQSENYGHDDVYADDLAQSGNNITSMTNGDGAYFTFTGNGFDIVSRTNNDTAGLIAYVYNGKKTTFTDADFKAGATDLVKTIVVDTYYSNGDLYQVPVISTTLANRDTYTVYLKALQTYTGQTTIYIDGVRIYNPLEDTSAYLDTEKNTKVEELRGLLLDTSKISFVAPDSDDNLQVGKGSMTTEVYLGDSVEETDNLNTIYKSGPNNELYVPGECGFGFSITGYGNSGWTLQIGAKSVNKDDVAAPDADLATADKSFTVYARPKGQEGTQFVEVKTFAVNTSTDMYYDVDLSTVIADQNWNSSNYDIAVVNTSGDYNIYNFVSFTTVKYSNTSALGTISTQTGRMRLASLSSQSIEEEEPNILNAEFGFASVSKGKYTNMTVKTKANVTDIQVLDPTGKEVTNFAEKICDTDADGNKQWNLKFKAYTKKGVYTYKVNAIVGDSVVGDSYSVDIKIK